MLRIFKVALDITTPHRAKKDEAESVIKSMPVPADADAVPKFIPAPAADGTAKSVKHMIPAVAESPPPNLP
jgi:hypothetical protein